MDGAVDGWAAGPSKPGDDRPRQSGADGRCATADSVQQTTGDGREDSHQVRQESLPRHRHTEGDRDQLDDARQRAKGRRRPNHTDVRIVQEIFADADPGQIRCDANRELRAGAMLNAGIITETGNEIRLSDDVRFSLMID